jgi:hypothetical protein
LIKERHFKGLEVMPDSRTRSELQRRLDQRKESTTMLAVLMAGIAMLFIAGIVSAFFYAKDTNPLVAAKRTPPPLGASPPGGGAETTGSGGGAAGSADRKSRPDLDQPPQAEQGQSGN